MSPFSKIRVQGILGVKALNFDLKAVGEKRLLQLNELKKFHQAYENEEDKTIA